MSEHLEALLIQWMQGPKVTLSDILRVLLLVAVEARRRMLREGRT